MLGARSKMLSEKAVLSFFVHLKLRIGLEKARQGVVVQRIVRLCALLRVNTTLQGYYFWYFKG